MNPLFEGQGDTKEFYPEDLFPFIGKWAFCLVESGSVDIYFDDLETKKRLFLTTLHQGDLFFIQPQKEPKRLLGVFLEKTEIRILSAEKLLQKVALKPSLFEKLEAFQIKCLERILPQCFEEKTVFLQKSEEVFLKKGEKVLLQKRVKKEPFSLVFLKGSIELSRAKKPWSKGSFIPFFENLFLTALEDTKIRGEELVFSEEGDLFTFISQIYSFLLEEATRYLEEKKLEEKKMGEKIYDLDFRAKRDSEYFLASVLHPKMLDIFTGHESPLVSSLKLIAIHLKISFRGSSLKKGKDLSYDEEIRRLCFLSKIPFRKVHILQKFARKDAGPLLVFSKKSHKPFALIPKGPDQYFFIDPTSKEERIFKEEDFHSLEDVAYVFYKKLPEPPSRKNLLSFVAENQFRDIFTTILAGLLSGLLLLYIPLGVGWIFGITFSDQSFSLLYQIALGFLFVAFGFSLFTFVQSFAILRMETIIGNKMQAGIWDRLFKLPMSFFQKFSPGDLFQRVNAIDEMRQILNISTITGLFSGVFACFYLAIMLYRSWKLALFTSIPLLIGSFAYGIGAYIATQKNQSILEKKGKIYAFLVEMLSGITKLRTMHAETRAFSVWAKQFSQKKQEEIQVEKMVVFLRVLQTAFQMTATLFLYYGFSYLIREKAYINNDFTIGVFLSYLAAFGAFSAAIFSFSSEFVSLFAHIVPLWKRAKPVLEEETEMSDQKDFPPNLRGYIHLEKVFFRYDKQAPMLLQDINIEIGKGQFVAIVGPSGSGKSTLFKMLLGFFTPEKGRIFYDKITLETVDIVALRRQMGVVLQESAILGGSLRENILCGVDCSDERIMETLEIIGFADEVHQLPMGLDTFLAEGGSNISGGIKQRILLARALVKRPKILLLDEATSALDNVSQEIIRKNLESLQITRVVIAHRLSTIVGADNIYVLDKGKIVQEGTFEQLKSVEGAFQNLVQRQMM